MIDQHTSNISRWTEVLRAFFRACSIYSLPLHVACNETEMCDNRSYIAKDKKHRIKRKKQKSKRKGEWMRQTARKKNMRKVKTVAWREKSKTQKSRSLFSVLFCDCLFFFPSFAPPSPAVFCFSEFHFFLCLSISLSLCLSRFDPPFQKNSHGARRSRLPCSHQGQGRRRLRCPGQGDRASTNRCLEG